MRDERDGVMDHGIADAFEAVDMSQFAVSRNIGVREVPDIRVGVVQLAAQGRYDPVWHHWWDLQSAADITSCRAVMGSALRRSTLWFISEEMTAILDHAAKEMPAHTLGSEPPPDDHGFVVFHRPLTGIDSQRGAALEVGAMSWHTFGPMPEKPQPLVEIVSWSLMRRGDHEFWFPIGRATWVVGCMSNVWQWGLEGDDQALASVTEDRHRISALWTLARQDRPGHVDIEKPDRAAARRSRREDIEVDTLRVVRLRRSERAAEDGAHGSVLWTHRWIVSGHWRQQWFPSLEEHRPRWIAAYPKGPSDKPLVLKDTVKALVR